MKNLSSFLVLLLLLSLACMESAAVGAVPPTLVVAPSATKILPTQTVVVDQRQESEVGMVFTVIGFEPYQARVMSDALNVRNAPTELADIDRRLSQGEYVTVYAVSSNGWGRISPDGVVDAVWINLDYVEVMP